MPQAAKAAGQPAGAEPEAAAGTAPGEDEDEQQAAPSHHARGCLAAVIENRAKEVGLACLDLHSMKLTLCQFIEASRSYTGALIMLEQVEPSELIVVASAHQAFAASGINGATQPYFQHVPLPRNMFDDTKGAALIETYASASSRQSIRSLSGNKSTCSYLAFGAAGALLHYATTERSCVLRAGSVELEMHGNSLQHLFLDPSAVESLELVRTIRWGERSRRSTSLFDIMNHTQTVCGARLLKTSILQPFTHIGTINARLDALQELLATDGLVFNIGACLGTLPKDLDKLCSNLAIRQGKTAGDQHRRIAYMVDSVVLLRDVLRLLPQLAGALEVEGAGSALLAAIKGNISRPEFAELLKEVEDVLDEDASISKAQFANKVQQCFAVKKGRDNFLDLARTTFCRVTDSVHELTDKYKAATGMESIKINYTTKQGFHLLIKDPTSSTAQAASMGTDSSKALPRSFIVLEKRARGTLSCTTLELNALNARLRDSANDCMVLTDLALEQLLGLVMQQMPLLQKLVDNIALLDLLCSFSTFASQSPSELVRPKVEEAGPLAIVQGRHPVMERLCSEASFQANDTYMSESSSLHIITGPNMSGKSTYLKQVALIAIMAQMGCYVPAAFAALRPFDKLFTRVGTADSIETNSSSFMVEMQDMAYIIDSATARSLVLVDELGIAWAMCEHFLACGAYTLFATHFKRLEELAALYPNCKLWHMQVDILNHSLDFKWTMAPSRMSAQAQLHYGVVLARSMGIDQAVLDRALGISQVLQQEEQERCAAHAQETGHLVQLYSLVHKLSCVARQWVQSPGAPHLKRILAELKREAQQVCMSAVVGSAGSSARSSGRTGAGQLAAL